jgi:phospholipid transport system substrate-binding protein
LSIVFRSVPKKRSRRSVVPGATCSPVSPLSLLALFLLFLLLPSAIAAQNDADDSIRNFIDRVNETSMNFFSSGTDKDARERCRSLLAWAFDVPVMAKEALGSTWDKITDEERKKFLDAFEEDIIGAYLRRMRPSGAILTFVGHRPPVDGDQLAASRRSAPGKPDQTWIWRMRRDGQSWRIVDVLLNGRSAVDTERHEYASVLENNNWDMDALIAFMLKRGAQ